MDESEQPKLYDPIRSILLTILIFFSSQIFAGVVLGSILAVAYNTNDPGALIESNMWFHFAYVAVIEAVTIGIIYWLLKIRKLNLGSIGINKPKLKYIGYALGGYVIYFVLFFAVLLATKALIPGLDLEKKQELGVDMATQGRQLLPVFMSLIILAPITEEIVMRGFLFGGLRTRLRFLPAAIITSILFGLAHITQASEGLLWAAAIDTCILSMILCYLRETTGSLWAPILVHMMKNSLAFVFLFNLIG